MNLRCLILVVAAPWSLAAPPQAAAPLPEAQRSQIILEVKAAVQAMVDQCQRLDVDAAMKDMPSGPEGLVVSSEGQILSVTELREGLRSFYAQLTKLRLTPIQEAIRPLAPDLALYTWTYKVEGTAKSGTSFVINPEAATFLLRKVGGVWKFIFFQESSGPAQRTPAPGK